MAQSRYFSNTALPTTFYASCTSSATTIQVVSVTGLPASYPFTMDAEWGTANAEVITVTQAPTGSAGNYTFANCVRGVDGTTGVAHASGAAIAHGASAQDFTGPNAHIGATSGVHGIAGNVVGDADTQTLSNKNLTSGTNTFPTFNQNTTGSSGSCTGNAATATSAGSVTGLVALANGGVGSSGGGATATQSLTASAVALTGLSASLAVAGTYLVRVKVFTAGSGTTGTTTTYAFTFGGTVTSCGISWRSTKELTTTTADYAGGSITTITTTMVTQAKSTTSALVNEFYAEGILVVSVAGTLAITGLCSTSGDEIVQVGSWLQAERLA